MFSTNIILVEIYSNLYFTKKIVRQTIFSIFPNEEPNENNDREYVGKFKAEYEITTNTTSLYYATINIVDYLALYEDVIPKIKKSRLYRVLIYLQSITGDTVEDIADANDAGGCKTWSELVNRFKELHKKGERY